MSPSTPDSTQLLADVESWVDNVVVRHRFCPFAKPAISQGSVRYSAITAVTTETALEQIAARIEALIEEPDSETTELLILPFVVESFDDFLDLSALAEALIESLAWQDKVQLATFHPHYCFADTDPDSIENYTNRCPWPVIQLLQVDAVSRALERVENPDEIPARNIECLQSMDEAAVDRLLRDSCAG